MTLLWIEPWHDINPAAGCRVTGDAKDEVVDVKVAGKFVLFVLTVFGLSLVAAVFMVSQVCHLGALSLSLFHAYGQCGATDAPSEVFWSFVIIGVTIFTPLVGLLILSIGKRTAS